MRFSKISTLMGFALAASAQKVKFLPLGDSITEITCWRAIVWDMLSAEGVADQVDFVGSMTNNPQNCKATSAGFDTGHEGHSGWQAVDIANQYIEGWSESTVPDVVNFMLGTNDVNMGKTTAQIIAAYDKILATLRAVNPNVKVVIDKLIPLPFKNAPVVELNKLIPGWVETNTTPESPIVIADCSEDNGYTAAMLRDGVHPNDTGDKLMADQIGPLVTQFIKDVIAERGE
ncbi:unnamed protein product [Parascedosporium putredinis]|uniref:SGNH hydrolase-type esterase domain-containing protein n=1 Tax=Parascedosporium putredinis TaxID=1442378 RepID=A0A9P1H344_9PEZI|nr:unnamed protein product [Parascedosporium putredinis]CAI7994829.1 unnamed protein product [Parascedosporium putredinis]